jgi:hypothetical protein
LVAGTVAQGGNGGKGNGAGVDGQDGKVIVSTF